MSGIGSLAGLGKRLLLAAADRVIAFEETERKQLPSRTDPEAVTSAPIEPGKIEPVRLDVALARLRAGHPPVDAPQGPDMSD